MKRRPLLSLIRATASFLAVAMAFGNLCLAKNTGAIEEMTVTGDGGPRRIDAPVGAPEGVSSAGAFGVNETAPKAISVSGEALPFEFCFYTSPMGTWRYLGLSTRIVFLILLIMFGTALGVIDVFAPTGGTDWAGISAVAAVFAEALSITAAGLAVGIPVTWLFKYFSNQVDNFVIEMDDASAELTSFFLKQCDKKYVCPAQETLPTPLRHLQGHLRRLENFGASSASFRDATRSDNGWN